MVIGERSDVGAQAGLPPCRTGEGAEPISAAAFFPRPLGLKRATAERKDAVGLRPPPRRS